jgi:hypothetical protein
MLFTLYIIRHSQLQEHKKSKKVTGQEGPEREQKYS